MIICDICGETDNVGSNVFVARIVLNNEETIGKESITFHTHKSCKEKVVAKIKETIKINFPKIKL